GCHVRAVWLACNALAGPLKTLWPPRHNLLVPVRAAALTHPRQDSRQSCRATFRHHHSLPTESVAHALHQTSHAQLSSCGVPLPTHTFPACFCVRASSQLRRHLCSCSSEHLV